MLYGFNSRVEKVLKCPMIPFRPNAQLKISLTSSCNNACDICFRNTGRQNVGGETLCAQIIKSLLRQGAELGFLGVYWTGGEPLLRYDELVSLTRYACTLGLVPSMVTNGGPMGAFGEYKAKNRALFESAGTYGSSCEEIVTALSDAGLQRIYFSVDASHNSLSDSEPVVAHKVPTAAAAAAIDSCLRAGFGYPHPTEAVGHRLRISSTASGGHRIPTEAILNDTLRRAQLVAISPTRYAREDGSVAVKRRETSAVGAAEKLAPSCVDNQCIDSLFGLRCENFRQRKDAYDNGLYHHDLHVDHTGTVFLCGNGMFPLGNIHTSSLSEIVADIAAGRAEEPFAKSVAVFNRIYRLSNTDGIGNRAVGEALRLVYKEAPELLKTIQCEGTACTALGTDSRVQTAFIAAFDRLNR